MFCTVLHDELKKKYQLLHSLPTIINIEMNDRLASTYVNLKHINSFCLFIVLFGKHDLVIESFDWFLRLRFTTISGVRGSVIEKYTWFFRWLSWSSMCITIGNLSSSLSSKLSTMHGRKINDVDLGWCQAELSWEYSFYI